MNELFEWIKERKGKVFGVAVAFFVVPVLLVHILFKIPGPGWLKAEWSAGEMLGFIGAFYAFAGTILFSMLALYQNHVLSEKEKEREEERSEMEHRLAVKQNQPYLVFELIGYNGTANKYTHMKMKVINKSENPAYDIKIWGLKAYKNLGRAHKIDPVTVFEFKSLVALEEHEFKWVHGGFRLSENEHIAFDVSYRDKYEQSHMGAVVGKEYDKDKSTKWLNMEFAEDVEHDASI